MKRKKTIKMRGSKTHGFGSKKKHRGSGSQGGVGFAGSTKHMRLWVKKHHPEHLINPKFKSLRGKNIKKQLRTINLDDLQTLVAKKSLKEVDLQKLGFDKILGRGAFTSKVKITGALMTPGAKEKLESAGATLENEKAEPKETEKKE